MNVIFESLAYLDNYSSSYEKINSFKSFEVYIKNALVSLSSIKEKNNDSDVVLVINFEMPKTYNDIFERNGIKIVKCDFDSFKFEDKLRYSLAYFKLCAFKYMVNTFNYDNYAQVDCDTYTFKSFKDIWEECKYFILALEIPYAINSSQSYVYEEAKPLLNNFSYFQYYGSEFIAANRENSLQLINCCEQVYKDMMCKSIRSKSGDEFIWNIAICNNDLKVKNAQSYVMRCFTIRPYIFSSDFKIKVLLHFPLEKNVGFLYLYDKIVKGKRIKADRVYKLMGLKIRKRPLTSLNVRVINWYYRKVKGR